MPGLNQLQVSRNDRSANFDASQVEEALAVINAQLGKLEKSFMEATEEKTRVEGQARACQERLGLAER